MNAYTGVVKKVVIDKKFGFIRNSEGQDFFFHRNDLIGVEIEDLDVNDEVTFSATYPDKGPRAIDVRRISTPNN